MFAWKSHPGLKFYFGQNDRYEIHTVLSFISPQFMWTQVKSWLNTEVRFSTKMKSHTGLSSFRFSCERTLRICLHSSLQKISNSDIRVSKSVKKFHAQLRGLVADTYKERVKRGADIFGSSIEVARVVNIKIFMDWFYYDFIILI